MIGPPDGQAFHVWLLEWVGGTPFELPGLPLDAGGSLHLPFVFPIGVPSGVQLWFQAKWPDPGAPEGHAASNALLATVPSDC